MNIFVLLTTSTVVGFIWAMLTCGFLSILKVHTDIVWIASTITGGFAFCVTWLWMSLCEMSGSLSEQEGVK